MTFSSGGGSWIATRRAAQFFVIGATRVTWPRPLKGDRPLTDTPPFEEDKDLGSGAVFQEHGIGGRKHFGNGRLSCYND